MLFPGPLLLFVAAVLLLVAAVLLLVGAVLMLPLVWLVPALLVAAVLLLVVASTTTMLAPAPLLGPGRSSVCPETSTRLCCYLQALLLLLLRGAQTEMFADGASPLQ